MIIRTKGFWFLATAMCMAVASFPAQAWRGGGGSGSFSGRNGGSASWSGGSGSATGAHGGSAAWSDGSGSATGARGGSAAWNDGSGYAHGADGGSAAWSGGSGYAHGADGGSAAWSHSYYPAPVPAYGYRPPVYYGNAGYSGGDVAAAGVAGLAVGAMAGAAVASSNAPPPATVVIQQPMAPAQIPIGSSLTYLPGGCANINTGSGQYYQCGMNWFRPYFGNNGAYYQAVPAPY